ncbi:Nucleosomal histone H3-Lys79 methylase [Actinomortierella ambigua]|uniref:Histone-lysine N-methyltransferase, H3 lysine-79 specific n=1 Tax=Actinomortierella ambigua TaxID=1343610 RepID=A0A9P6PUZ1_9FUNG|nr:Nucleosomal histone H3-Lys79 methylase [Actinomortierella ambigua]
MSALQRSEEAAKPVEASSAPTTLPSLEQTTEAHERSVPPHDDERLSTPPPTVPQRRHFHEIDDTSSISTLSSPASSNNYFSSSAQSTPISGSPVRKEMTPLKKRKVDALSYQDSTMSSSTSVSNSPFSSAPSSPDRHQNVPVVPLEAMTVSGSNGSLAAAAVNNNDLHSSKSLAMELFGSDVEDDDDKFSKAVRGVDGAVPATGGAISGATGGDIVKKATSLTASKDRAAGVGIAKKRIPKREPKVLELEVTKSENGEDIVRTIKSTPLSSRGGQGSAGGSKAGRKASIDGGNPGQERRMSIIHSDQIVQGAMERYKNHFHMLVEDSDSTVASSPSSTSADTMHVSVEYPGPNGREKFTLMKPFLSRSKTETDDKDEYNPIEDLVCTVRVIASQFFPADEYESLFGTPTEGLLRNLTKSRNRKDGAQFLKAVEEYNQLMRRSKSSGAISKQIDSYGSNLPYELVVHILQQVYSRTVASKASKLNQYEAFSNNVYGEILPILTREFIQRTKLTKDKVFVDLGCGIGNVVLQVALQTGAESYGIEIMDNPAKFAKKQSREFEARTKAYGLTHGKVTMIHGDFLDTPELAGILARADVVLVNNYAFNSALNQSLLQLFLDLKEGCKIISLKTFVSLDHKITVRNAGSVESILKVKKYPYYTNAVSWTHNGGEYFIATVDRAEVQAFWAKAMANPAMLDDAPMERRTTSRRRH